MQDQLERASRDTDEKPDWVDGREVDFFRRRPRRPWPRPRSVAGVSVVVGLVAIGVLGARILGSQKWERPGGMAWGFRIHDVDDEWSTTVELPPYVSPDLERVHTIEPDDGRVFGWAIGFDPRDFPDELMSANAVGLDCSQQRTFVEFGSGAVHLDLPVTRAEIMEEAARHDRDSFATLVHEVSLSRDCGPRSAIDRTTGQPVSGDLQVVGLLSPMVTYRHGIIPRTFEVPVFELAYDTTHVQLTNDIEKFRECLARDLPRASERPDGCRATTGYRSR